MTDLTGLKTSIELQRPNLIMWVSVFLTAGIGTYFQLRFEPGICQLTVIFLACAALGLSFWRVRAPLTVFPLFALVFLIGFLLAANRAHRIEAPVLSGHFYGAVEGRIIAIDRSHSDRPRVTLDQVRLEGKSALETPVKVRISLHYPKLFQVLMPGQRVMITASLSPPSGPVEPGGFDFHRYAWFRQLGAVGYARTPLVEYAPPELSGLRMKLVAFRMQLSAGIKARLPGQSGAFAAAIMVGDRSAIDPNVLKDLRSSNLAHLLAISGLHMGLLTGFVFGGVRYGLALLPFLALRLPGKKVAAVTAFWAALCYLAISGANVATQRAFVMAAVMLLAVMLNRRALTLRAVVIAAIIVLALRPESLTEAGFQMSFAATTALVGVFAMLRDKGWLTDREGSFRLLRPVFALILSSAIAGAATAPVAAYHFNQISQFGLLANTLSVPVMGLVVMPSATIAALLLPVGLEGIALAVAGAGIDWILWIADWVAGFEDAVIHIAKPVFPALPVLAAGFTLLLLWQGKARFAGLAPVLSVLVLWSQSQRPDVLLSPNGRLLGIRTFEGRVINREKGNGFAARSWLENDGDGSDQATAFARAGFVRDGKSARYEGKDMLVVYVWNKNHEKYATTIRCTENMILIAPLWDDLAGPCVFIGKQQLRQSGAIAIVGKSGKTMSARQVTGNRLWVRPGQ